MTGSKENPAKPFTNMHGLPEYALGLLRPFRKARNQARDARIAGPGYAHNPD